MDFYHIQYLNCVQVQTLYFLKEQGVSIEFLYSQSFESSDQIYHDAIINKESKYDFSNNIRMCDLELLNVNRNRETFNTFLDARDYIHSMLWKRKTLFIQVDEFYLPYSNQFEKFHTNHSNILLDYSIENEQYNYQIKDNVGLHFGEYSYSDQVLMMAFDNTTCLKHVTDYTINLQDAVEDLKLEFRKKTRDYFKGFNDNGLLYKKFLELLNNGTDQEIANELEQYGNAFGLISGSRSAFNSFLCIVYKDDNIDFESLAECFKTAYVLMVSLYRAIYTKQIQREQFHHHCMKIMDSELRFLNNSKNSLLM
ncbi:Ribostamycin-hydroxybutanoate transferase [compost metagenome]